MPRPLDREAVGSDSAENTEGGGVGRMMRQNASSRAFPVGATGGLCWSKSQGVFPHSRARGQTGGPWRGFPLIFTVCRGSRHRGSLADASRSQFRASPPAGCTSRSISIIPHSALSSTTPPFFAGWWAWPCPQCGPYGKSRGPIFRGGRFEVRGGGACLCERAADYGAVTTNLRQEGGGRR